MLKLAAIGRQFRRLPHELLELTPFELSLAWACVRAADGERARRVAQRDGAIFPTLDIGAL